MSKTAVVQCTPYQASGAFTYFGILRSIFWGCAVALFLGAVYGYWMYYLYSFFSVLLPPIFGCAIGFAVSYAAREAQIRSSWIGPAVGALIGLFATYVGWVFWVLAWSGHELLTPVSDYGLLACLVEIMQEGIWYFELFQVKGSYLGFLWSLELCLVVAGAWFGGGFHADDPFCESCHNWSADTWESGDLDGTACSDKKRFKAELARNPKAALLSFSMADGGAYDALAQIKVKACPTCQGFYALGLTVKDCHIDDDGEETTRLRVLATNLMISHEFFQNLKGAYSKSGTRS
ncbi:MAG: hypothetical protein VYA30_13870 [Myxococcota bacterium]|nr:hypothetical protein [Myxococcota bacterium]